MPHRRVTVTIPSATGVPANNVVNTFHFTTPLPVTTLVEAQAIRDALVDFYHTAPTDPDNPATTAGRVGLYLSGVALVPTITIKIYRCETEVGVSASPLFEFTAISVAPFGASLYPEECAIVNSFKAAPIAGHSRGRERGRVYLGPLAAAALTIAGSRMSVATGPRQSLAWASYRLAQYAVAGVDWVVWSHADLLAYPVVSGHCDDAVDTQRRRGPKATLRQTWALP